MAIMSDIAELEYKNTKSILNASNFIFQIFNEVNNAKDKKNIDSSLKFYESFEHFMKNTASYKNDLHFARMAETRLG